MFVDKNQNLIKFKNNKKIEKKNIFIKRKKLNYYNFLKMRRTYWLKRFIK